MRMDCLSLKETGNHRMVPSIFGHHVAHWSQYFAKNERIGQGFSRIDFELTGVPSEVESECCDCTTEIHGQ